ncbi:DNA topoisomerase-3 [Peptoclostridium litorale DSM 5388]|uniref:DNA topoisomerase 3 n=1 Tax=Peptoclostridium litorale DSM 5388 TaxID=1121324 RepID=A0A069RI29_PEPLI|nr:DNA topoisomerase III [Peptoclostridium litorale]KDR96679.1 DNA topoisomerase 3 [Peptoclostridium litorale DSM 5388]SIN67799.1 DNA topoisomerase-3 [Peptoclostridium litorale DSM 5388]
MGKTLVLAEKPSVAADIAKVLGCSKKSKCHMEGGKYIVTWAFGHLVTLADPESYGERYKSWRLEDLPIIPDRPKLEVIRQSSRQYSAVKEQMHRKDVSEIVIATDAGREGELVARLIIEKANVKKRIKRLWISSVTDRAIKEGFEKLKPGSEYDNLYASAMARAESDWIVGINATRALTCRHNAQLSCGRVQTPTLGIIAQRDDEIRNFKPKQYYGISVSAGGLSWTWKDEKSGQTRTFDIQKRDKTVNSISGRLGRVSEAKSAHKKVFSPKLYDLTELQRDANRIFGYSAKETLSIMQRLYENHKLLTYPRTDSRYITSDMVETLKDRIRACGVGPYRKFAASLLKRPVNGNKSFVDNSKVSDHHAIIPTEEPVFLSGLSASEQRIYDLVVKRFMSVMFPPFEYEQKTLTMEIEGCRFEARGKLVTNTGWKDIYSNELEEDDEDGISDQTLPHIDKGDSVRIEKISPTQGHTSPPPYFSEGTLLSAMENPAKYMNTESKELIKTIGETGGLGTVATRADIIEKLFSSFLIEKKGNEIQITGKGRQLLELVPNDIKSPTLTAQWERKLSHIAKGSLKKEAFISEMKGYAKEIVGEIKSSSHNFKHDNMTKNKCPECGKYMLEVNGKRGKMLVCQDRECGHRKGVAKKTNARCPNCHKKLELRGEGEGKIFVCPCGHREKLSAFNKRKKEGGTKVSKSDVQKYLKKNTDEAPINSAFADALAGLKLD